MTWSNPSGVMMAAIVRSSIESATSHESIDTRSLTLLELTESVLKMVG